MRYDLAKILVLLLRFLVRNHEFAFIGIEGCILTIFVEILGQVDFEYDSWSV